ncbi:MAG: DUF2273 domain-containing protein [Christensenellales bacterium]
MTDFENFGLGEDQPERLPERTLRQTVAAALKAHLGPLAGGLVGLAVAILFLTLGFWRTLLIGLCVGVGVFVGGGAKRVQQVMLLIYNKLIKKK